MKCDNSTDIHILEDLLNTISVSGFEQDISSLFIKHLRNDVNQSQIDSMGNAITIVDGDIAYPKIMLEAHADEIGFQVLYITDSGHIYIRKNGSIDEQCIIGQHVLIQTRNKTIIPGVIGKKPIHLTSKDECHSLKMHQVWVDTGLSADEVKSQISIGDPVVISPNLVRLGKYRIACKALDNKLGLFVVMRAIKIIASRKQTKSTIYGVATVQEELGGRGAAIATYSIRPDISITVDLDFATDVPDCQPNQYGNVLMGEGVVISYNADSNIEQHQRLEAIAKEKGISYQITARHCAFGGTNASRIQISQCGVKTVSIGIPCRYMHTPVEVCDLRDVESAIQLIVAYCESFS